MAASPSFSAVWLTTPPPPSTTPIGYPQIQNPRNKIQYNNQSIMPFFKTPFNGYSVKFSLFYEHRLAVATSQNFGILGNGCLHVLNLSPSGLISHLPPLTPPTASTTSLGLSPATPSSSPIGVTNFDTAR
ncbi:uncharacterized protein LOC132270892 [Cornus florida]|uniref:uncharacterized protein LOC132270892 n=1 Tax=Cornus florida TaxID=4283 RepID=UPI00289663FB|nr:uncharacterized protein LOC132270892 [Cornus florida]